LAPQFRCTTHNSAANITSLQEVQLRQRNRISLRNTQIGSEYQIAAGGSVASEKQNFAAQHTNRQRISIRCSKFSCGSETHKSAANINSLQEVQLRQRNRISLRNTQSGASISAQSSQENTLIPAANITAEHINSSNNHHSRTH